MQASTVTESKIGIQEFHFPPFFTIICTLTPQNKDLHEIFSVYFFCDIISFTFLLQDLNFWIKWDSTFFPWLCLQLHLHVILNDLPKRKQNIENKNWVSLWATSLKNPVVTVLTHGLCSLLIRETKLNRFSFSSFLGWHVKSSKLGQVSKETKWTNKFNLHCHKKLFGKPKLHRNHLISLNDKS